MPLPMPVEDFLEHLKHFVHDLGQVHVTAGGRQGFDATLEVRDFHLGREAPFYINLAGQFAQSGTSWTHAMAAENELKFPLSQRVTRVVGNDLMTLDEAGRERPLSDSELWKLAGSILSQYYHKLRELA